MTPTPPRTAASAAAGLARCAAHADDPTPPPCGACKEARIAYEERRRAEPTPRVGWSQDEVRAEAARREREASRNPRAHIAAIREILAAKPRPA